MSDATRDRDRIRAMQGPLSTAAEQAMLKEPSAAEEAGDLRFEALLDDLATSMPKSPELPDGFERTWAKNRPFAPWEARRRRYWRVPFAVLGLHVALALFLILTPLWTLGPGTALAVFSRLLASAATRSLAALPLLAESLGKVSAAEGLLWAGLAAGALLGAGMLVLVLRFGRRGNHERARISR